MPPPQIQLSLRITERETTSQEPVATQEEPTIAIGDVASADKKNIAIEESKVTSAEQDEALETAQGERSAARHGQEGIKGF